VRDQTSPLIPPKAGEKNPPGYGGPGGLLPAKGRTVSGPTVWRLGRNSTREQGQKQHRVGAGQLGTAPFWATGASAGSKRRGSQKTFTRGNVPSTGKNIRWREGGTLAQTGVKRCNLGRPSTKTTMWAHLDGMSHFFTPGTKNIRRSLFFAHRTLKGVKIKTRETKRKQGLRTTRHGFRVRRNVPYKAGVPWAVNWGGT